MLFKVKLPEIFSVSLNICTGKFILAPALSFKVPDELTSVKPVFPIIGIVISLYPFIDSINEKAVPLYIAKAKSQAVLKLMPCELLA